MTFDPLTEAQAAQTELHKSTYWPAAQRQKGANHLWLTDVHLSNAIAALQQPTPPPPPPPPVPAGGQNITTPNATLANLTINNPNGLGVNVYGGAATDTIVDCDIGQTKDSSVLLQTHATGGHHLLRVKMHDSNVNGGKSYGVHGIYDAAKGTLVEQCESWNHPNGECYSPRWPNTYLRCKAHDGVWMSAFDFSDGTGGLLRVREFVGWNPTGAFYMAGGRASWTDGSHLGDNTFGWCVDHCTLDMRGFSGFLNFTELRFESWLTNCVVVTDNPGWLSHGSAPFHTDGTVVISSADFSTWLNDDYTPKTVSGSPIAGKAVASPAAMAEFGNMGNVGAF